MSKLVVVTGASSGIGLDCCLYLKRSGFEVLGTVRTELDKTRLADQGIPSVVLDLTLSERTVREAFVSILNEQSSFDQVSLVNNAGLALSGPVEIMAAEVWEEQFAVNLFGAVKATKILLPWIRRTRGRIVNISSVSGLMAMPFLGPYAASKFALEAFSDSLRRELHPSGAKVVLIEPGPVATPIWKKGLEKEGAMLEQLQEQSDEVQSYYRRPLQNFLRFVKKSEQEAVPTDWVASEVLRALSAANPKVRIVIGSRSTRWQACLLPLLPTKMLDSLVASSLWK